MRMNILSNNSARLLIFFSLLFFSLILLFVLYFQINYNGLYGQDSYEYARYAGEWKLFFQGEGEPGSFFWPLLFPVFGGLLAYVLNIPEPLALQTVSSLSWALASFFLILTASKLAKISLFRAVVVVIPLYSFAPYLFRSGFVAMSDHLTILFIVLSLFCYVSYINDKIKLYSLLFFVFTASAVMTRYLAFLVLIIPAIHLFITVVKNEKWSWLALVVLLSLVPLIPHLWIRQNNPLEFLNHHFVLNWDLGLAFVLPTYSLQLGSVLKLPNILYVLSPFFHPACFIGGALLIWYYKKLKWSNIEKTLFFSVLLYLFFLLGIYHQNMRYFVLLAPSVMLISLPVILEFLKRLNLKLKSSVFALIVVIQVGLSSYSLIPNIRNNLFERELSIFYENWERPGQTIYTYNTDVSLSYNCKKHNFVSLHQQYSLELKAGQFFMMNKNWLDERFKGLEPEFFYQKVMSADTEIIHEFDRNWVLYKVLNVD